MIVKRFLISFFAFFAFSFALTGVAGAQTDDACEGSSTDSASDTCEGEEVDVEVQTNPLPDQALPDTEVKGRQQLPVTGTESVTLALGGAALVAAGGLMVRRSTKTA